MGGALPKVVDTSSMPTQPPIKLHCRTKSALTSLRTRNEREHLLVVPPADAVMYRKKVQREARQTSHSHAPPAPPTRKPRVLVVTDQNDKDFVTPGVSSFALRRRRKVDEVLVLGDEIVEFESALETFSNDEASRIKLRKFVIAWKNALAYQQSKIIKVSTGIPATATSSCKQGISRWKLCHRHCLRCTSRQEAEHLLEDLLHKDSLYKFIQETENLEPMESTIVLKQDFRRNNFIEYINPVMSSERVPSVAVQVPRSRTTLRGRGEPLDDDMTITINVPVHAPVHISYEPEKAPQRGLEDDTKKTTNKIDLTMHSHSDSSLLDQKKEKSMNHNKQDNPRKKI